MSIVSSIRFGWSKCPASSPQVSSPMRPSAWNSSHARRSARWLSLQPSGVGETGPLADAHVVIPLVAAAVDPCDPQDHDLGLGAVKATSRHQPAAEDEPRDQQLRMPRERRDDVGGLAAHGSAGDPNQRPHQRVKLAA
jgi:hypothetical protein